MSFEFLGELVSSIHFLVFCRLTAGTGLSSRDTLSLDGETVIDVPEPYNHVSKYCASLGHKANHSFTPNCIYDM